MISPDIALTTLISGIMKNSAHRLLILILRAHTHTARHTMLNAHNQIQYWHRADHGHPHGICAVWPARGVVYMSGEHRISMSVPLSWALSLCCSSRAIRQGFQLFLVLSVSRVQRPQALEVWALLIFLICGCVDVMTYPTHILNLYILSRTSCCAEAPVFLFHRKALKFFQNFGDRWRPGVLQTLAGVFPLLLTATGPYPIGMYSSGQHSNAAPLPPIPL